MKEYTKVMEKDIGYGLRDEYRIGGQASEIFLHVALGKVHANLSTMQNTHYISCR
jgi:hypothetical protein